MKEKLRDFFHIVGLDIRRWDDMSVFSKQIISILNHLEINSVLDVGAHWGQYAEMLFRTGYNGAVISYEPLEKNHYSLMLKAKENPYWHVMPRMAIGNFNGEIEINVAGGNRSSSSALPMMQAHLNAAPQTAYIGKEKANIERLDSQLPPNPEIFLKIDTQGYEMQVLEGATGIIDNIKAVQVELSTCELYEGQALDWQIKNWLQERGFTLWALNPFLYDPKNGKLLQYDAIFVRE